MFVYYVYTLDTFVKGCHWWMVGGLLLQTHRREVREGFLEAVSHQLKPLVDFAELVV